MDGISIGTIYGLLTLQDTGFGTGITAARQHMAQAAAAAIQTDASIQKLAGGLQTAGVAFSAFSAVILAGLGYVAKMGIDAVESESLVSVSFGNMKGAADEWSKGLSKSLGLNEFELRKQAGTLFNMTTSMGLSRDAAFGMSTGISKLAADMASFRNISIDEAMIKLKSGLVGETEPLKAIGILVDEATVKTYAYSTGIARQGETLTAQQKVLARYQAILAQTSNDQGDLARTLQSPANQLRIMQTRIQETATALGVSLIPMISMVVGAVSGMVPYIQAAAKWFADLPMPVKATAVGMALLFAAIGPLLLVLGTLLSSLTSIVPLIVALGGPATLTATGVLTGLGGAIGSMMSAVPVIALLGGIAAGIYKIIGAWDAYKASGMTFSAFVSQKEDDNFLRRLLGLTDLTMAGFKGVAAAAHDVNLAVPAALAASTTSLTPFADGLKAARAEIAGLSAVAKADLVTALKSGTVELADLKAQSGLSETALKLLKQEVAATSAEVKRMDFKGKFLESTQVLNAEIASAQRAGIATRVIMDMFGKQASEAGQKGVAFGVTVGSAIRSVAGEFNRFEASQTLTKLKDNAASFFDKFSERQFAKLQAGMHDSAVALIEWPKTLIKINDHAREFWGNFSEQRFAKLSSVIHQNTEFVVRDLMGWRAHADEIVQAFDRLGSSIGGAMGETVRGIAGVVAAFARAKQAAIEYARAGGATSAEKMASVVGGVGSVLGSTSSGGTAARVVGGALGGAAAGASIGAAFAPATLGTSIVIGAAAGALVGWIRGMSASAKATAEANKQIGDLKTGLVGTYGTLGAASRAAEVLGINLDTALAGQGVKGAAALSAAIDKLKADTDRLNKALDTYGISWTETGNAARGARIEGVTRQLLADYRVLTAAGVAPTRAIQGMSGAFSQLIVDSVTAGQKIPAALQPMLTTLIRSGQLTEDAARALLGMSSDGVPAFKDIEAAAGRYGLQLDALGPKIGQIRINDIAKTIAADWLLLTTNGADANVVAEGMRTQVQGLVTDALRLGLTLPENLRPVIQTLINAGTLTDQFGNKLTSTSGLTFDIPLSQKFDDLIAKLGDLIDTLSHVGDAAEDGFGRARGAAEALGRAVPRGSIPVPDLTGEAEHRAGGGMVGFPGSPRGTDTVPVWATPGEVMLTAAEASDYRSGGARILQPLTINMSGRTVTRVVIEGTPRELRLRGVAAV